MERNFAYFLFAGLVLISGCSSGSRKGVAQGQSSVADTGKAVISFAEYEHNFGKVREGEKVACIFTFTNNGTGDLIVNSAVASCGCTVPKFSAKPVPPGKTGDIEVQFNTEGRNGIQTKTITVRSNAKTPVVILKITTEIINNN